MQIRNTDDTIDSRDVIDRIKDLEEMLPYEGGLDGDEFWELATLRELAKDCEDSVPDWRFGEILIRDSYFEQYAQEIAEDIGAFDNESRWPYNHIDWEAAARQLQDDYLSVVFDGVLYWIRM